MPDIDFPSLNDWALDTLARHGNAPEVREAARAEQQRRKPKPRSQSIADRITDLRGWINSPLIAMHADVKGALRVLEEIRESHAELLAALKAIKPHAWGHSEPECKGKVRDPENCAVCKSIWAANDAIDRAEGRAP